MIIDANGNILQAWLRKDGPTITDTNSPYGIKFNVGVYYNETQKAQFAERKELKKYLNDTDYRALKYADGAYTEEEYAPYKEKRAAARARINEIEETFVEPTLTRQQLDEAEYLAMNKLKEQGL